MYVINQVNQKFVGIACLVVRKLL